MATARNLIERAMRKVGVLTLNEAATADEANEALLTLNDLLASWSTDSLYIVARTTESFPLIGSQAEYTIGTGGDFDTDRPVYLVDSYFRNGDIDYPLETITDENYANIGFKGVSGLPEYINYTNAYPLGRVKIYPAPSTVYTLYLVTEKPVTSIATLDTVIDLPPGWERALVYSLAIELAPEYGQPIDPIVDRIAMSSKEAIKNQVSISRSMDANASLNGNNNIYTGYYN